MEPREIWAPKQRFKNLELLLGLSDWSLQDRRLRIRCSDGIADRFKAKLDILRLYFERLEAIDVNDENLRFVHREMSEKLNRIEIDPSKCVKLSLRSMKRD